MGLESDSLLIIEERNKSGKQAIETGEAGVSLGQYNMINILI